MKSQVSDQWCTEAGLSSQMIQLHPMIGIVIKSFQISVITQMKVVFSWVSLLIASVLLHVTFIQRLRIMEQPLIRNMLD
jgi:hypothetical protein